MRKLPNPSPIWKQYIESGKLENTSLSPLVLESWQRSAAQKIDPLRIRNNDLLDRQALLEKIEQCHQLVEIATPVMSELYNLVKGFGFTVLLADHQGYIIKGIGDPEFVEKARKVWLSVGANWHETVKGTNAIGTAIVSQKPVNIFAWEHFCRENHFLTCAAAPIFNPRGELAGVLDISGDYRNADRHILGVVLAAAKAIENRLLLDNTQKQLVLAFRQISTLMDMVPEGLLVVDQDGRITRVNHAVSTLLGLPPQACIGQPLEEVLSQGGKWLNDLKRGKGSIEKIVTLTPQPSMLPVTCQVKLVADNRENFYGAVAAIRKLPRNDCAVGKPTRYCLEDIIGDSVKISEAKRLARLAARSTSTVLLQGETGTGKEMFAQAIHNASGRAGRPFVAINCGAIPANLIESELFGYEEGAFTGARKGGQAGKFELANGGTIFLDEISEMPLQQQVNLLRILEEKQVVRIGGYKVIPLDIRVIAATNKDLYQEVQKGSFRLDLFYRLNVLSIDIPSLRERGSDILALTEYFLKKLNERLKKNVTKISPEIKAWLQAYTWPGNVRELENILERAVNLAEGDTLHLEHLPPAIRNLTAKSISTHNNAGFSLKEREIQAIKEALEQSEGNISEAAKLLGIGRNTLYRKMKEFGINQKPW